MAKKIILRVVLIIAILLVSITGYYFIIDRQSNVPEEINEKIYIETNHFMGRKVFKLVPKDEKNEKVILYFHGGSYIAELTDQHWNFLANLTNDTKSTVIVPDYPLAPKSTYKNVLNMIEPLYKETLANYGAENVIVMGDSAGGGMALGLLEKMAANNIKQPSQTILISPWLDISMSNPQIDNVEDQQLDKNTLYLAGVAYARGITQNEEYFVSPVKGNVEKLKNLTIFIGTHDILNPDCYLLQEKAKKAGIDIEIKEYKNASHIWIINNNDDLSKKAYEDLINTIV